MNYLSELSGPLMAKPPAIPLRTTFCPTSHRHDQFAAGSRHNQGFRQNQKMDEIDLPQVPPEFLYDYHGICWWCGDIADSREHKWKKSEVVELFGRGEYHGSVVWGHDDEIDPLRGPKSSGLMFSKSLCANCNGARSQSFDNAYSGWSHYFIAHHTEMLTKQEVDFDDVFIGSAEPELPNLARYYMKHVGCRLAENAARVPQDIIDYLDGVRDQPQSVLSQLGIRDTVRALIEQHGTELMGLWMRPSVANHSLAVGHLTSFKSAIGIGAIEFLYDVNLNPSVPDRWPGVLVGSRQHLWSHSEDLYGLGFGGPRISL